MFRLVVCAGIVLVAIIGCDPPPGAAPAYSPPTYDDTSMQLGSIDTTTSLPQLPPEMLKPDPLPPAPEPILPAPAPIPLLPAPEPFAPIPPW
ncbi:MAG TPA: hypothetical protein VGZ47_11935 [Gemmataceae bacterium]|nr:hypothetical protein [Gemmataceae bacterium]